MLHLTPYDLPNVVVANLYIFTYLDYGEVMPPGESMGRRETNSFIVASVKCHDW